MLLLLPQLMACFGLLPIPESDGARICRSPSSRRAAIGTAAAAAAAAAAASFSSLPRALADADLPSVDGIAGVRRVLVAGASGRTGRLIVERLAKSGFEVIAGVRGGAGGSGRKATAAVSSSSSSFPAGTTILPGFDLAGDALSASELSAEMLRLGVTDVVCAVGFSPTFIPEDDRRLAEAVDYLGTLKLITAAEAAKLPGRFVLLSSLGVNALGTSPSAKLLDSSLGNVLVQKRAAERALRGLPASSVDWTIVRPGLLLKEVTQGGVLLGPEDRWTGADAEADRRGLGPPVKCASPFLASSGAVCAATRGQVADVCVAALSGESALFSRRVVEVVARPDVPLAPNDYRSGEAARAAAPTEAAGAPAEGQPATSRAGFRVVGAL